MAATQDLTVPREIDSPAKFAAWFDIQLKSLTTDLSDEDADRIRSESLKTIADISLKWGNPATRTEAEGDFKNYIRKTEAALGTNADFAEARELAASPGVVGQLGNLVGMLDATKAALFSSLLGSIGFERIASGLGKLGTLEAMVSTFSGNSIFGQIKDALNRADTRITSLNGDTPTLGDIRDKATGAADMLPEQLRGVLGKFLTLPGAEDPEIPANPKGKYTGR